MLINRSTQILGPNLLQVGGRARTKIPELGAIVVKHDRKVGLKIAGAGNWGGGVQVNSKCFEYLSMSYEFLLDF